MPIPPAFADFNIDASSVTVWLFKKSAGTAAAVPTFKGHWIATDDGLDAELKASVAHERAKIEEVLEYGLLAQNNEASALRISTAETLADRIVDQTTDPLPQLKVVDTRKIQNTSFYVIRLVHGDAVLHAVRKADASFRTKRRLNAIDVLFSDNTLELLPSPGFSLSRYIDFFIVGDDILITNKASFESVLSYKEAHAEDFQTLQAEADFSQLFTDLEPLVAFVGSNKIHLRRACAIRAKGHYRNADFMGRLRQNHAQYNLTLQFNADGLLVPTPETCGDIITALLDHRLTSAFSHNIYDVPDATQLN